MVGTTAADRRLAVYGTLAPGEPNHHQLAGLDGRWLAGEVNGRIFASGCGTHKALTLDPSAPPVAVRIFESADLPDHWSRLDDFEGESYRRVVTDVTTDEGQRPAWIYVAANG